ncbi:MAG: hypothetical protein HY321_01345 [Armatimonadetes bacterium]|nr:hypothetical protein [Armatimonadota bacterium]
MRTAPLFAASLGLTMVLGADHGTAHARGSLQQEDYFPIVLYAHWTAPTEKRALEVVDDARAHGFNTVNAPGASEQARAVRAHAQAAGMAISGFCDSLHPFKTETTPCVHSPDYPAALDRLIGPKRAEYDALSRPWAATVVDEPCVDNRLTARDPARHLGFVCHCEHCQRAFRAQYGVDLPEKMPSPDQPALRRQYVEFYDDYWAEVWKRSVAYMKANRPDLLIANTYTENNCLGRHVDLVFGDLLRWAEPLDWLAADIYPYYYGRNENDAAAIEWDMKRSRLLLAFLRCAGREYGIPFAWWVGCTSSTEETPKAIRHMSYTAIGQGAQGLIGWGAYFPEKRPVLEYNPALWEDAGKTFRDIGKIGADLRHAKKTARIALLCSETEHLFSTPSDYVGPFYYDLVPAYDALLKAFGDVDLLYERQIAAGRLKEYQALVIANVEHLAGPAARAIEEFVNSGGVLICDRVPELDEENRRTDALSKVLGYAERKRLNLAAPDAFPSVYTSSYGKGKTVLLRFRLGSFYAVPELWRVLRAQLQASGVYPLAVSSNPDIESNYLAAGEGFLLVAVNRLRQDGKTEMACYDPGFTPKRVRDLISGRDLRFRWDAREGQKVLSIPLEVEALSGRVIRVSP